MKRYYICPIIGSGTDEDPYHSAIAYIRTNGGRRTDMKANPLTGIPLFKNCVVLAFGDESILNTLTDIEGVIDITKIPHQELHQKLAEGRSESFTVRDFPETTDPDTLLTQALQQQHRSATASGLIGKLE